MNATDKITQTLTADDREQRELEILRDLCHALIEIASPERLREMPQRIADGLGSGGNRKLEILRKAALSLLEIADEGRLNRLARMLADQAEAKRREDQKLYGDWHKLATKGYLPPMPKAAD
jgi:hypothetical protein